VENIIAPTSSNWGETKERELTVDITPYYDRASKSWKARITKADQRYTIWYRRIAGVAEASLAAATTQEIYCTMRTDLANLGYPPGRSPMWYMTSAVEAHERVHVGELKSSLDPEFGAMKKTIESLSVPFHCGDTLDKAKAALKALPDYNRAINTAYNNFVSTFYGPLYPDPNANTDAAEHAVVDPLIKQLDQLAKTKGWTCH
jgi:hypothetical protein